MIKDKPVLEYYIKESNGGWVLRAKQEGADSAVAFFFEEYESLANLAKHHFNDLLEYENGQTTSKL